MLRCSHNHRLFYYSLLPPLLTLSSPTPIMAFIFASPLAAAAANTTAAVPHSLAFPAASPLKQLPPTIFLIRRSHSAFSAGPRAVLALAEIAASTGREVKIPASPPTKPAVLVAEKLGEAGLELLRGFAEVECAYNLSAEELRAKVPLVDALVVRSGTKVTREVFEAAKGRLKVVGRAGVGIDNVDLQAATEFGCLVVNAPTANTVAAAEHGIALLAAMARNVAQADASMKAGEDCDALLMVISSPSLLPLSVSIFLLLLFFDT